MQSGAFKRSIFIRPLRQWQNGMFIGFSQNYPTGFAKQGASGPKPFDGWMLEELGLKRVLGESQLYAKRDANGRTVFLLATLTDDLLMAGSEERIKKFVERISERFMISNSIIDNDIKYNGCLIKRDGLGNTSMSMSEYLDAVDPIQLDRSRSQSSLDMASESELELYRALAGELVWLGVMPQSAAVWSWMLQKMPHLKFKDLKTANKDLESLRKMSPVLKFALPRRTIAAAEIVTYSDASFNISPKISYG